MNIQDERIPYTYVIKFSDGKWYYGVRYGKGCNPNDLGVTYFTSSKIVREKIKTVDHSFHIRQTFDDPKKARSWESKCLRRLFSKDRSNLLNLHYHKAVDDSVPIKSHNTKLNTIDENGLNVYQQAGKKVSITRQNMSPEKKAEYGRNISKGRSGIKLPTITGDLNSSKRPEVRKKISDGWYRQLQEGRLSLSNNKGKSWYNNGTEEMLVETCPNGWIRGRLTGMKYGKQKIVKCTYCGKEGGTAPMRRFHFENCNKRES